MLKRAEGSAVLRMSTMEKSFCPGMLRVFSPLFGAPMGFPSHLMRILESVNFRFMLSMVKLKYLASELSNGHFNFKSFPSCDAETNFFAFSKEITSEASMDASTNCHFLLWLCRWPNSTLKL